MKVKGWEDIFSAKKGIWKRPHTDVVEFSKLLKKRGAKRVLDLGCGAGRHVVYLAKKGFDVYGFDISKSGIEIAKEWLKKEKLKSKFKIGDMTKLPFKKEFFDAVISIQTIHHNRVSKIKKTIREIYKVLKPKGLILISVPGYTISQRLKQNYWKDKAVKIIEKNTFIPLNGLEKGLPHHTFTKKELKELFSKFKILEIHKDKFVHWVLVGEKR